MEQARIAPSQPRPPAEAKANGVGNGKPASGDNASGKMDGFARLMATLGDEVATGDARAPELDDGVLSAGDGAGCRADASDAMDVLAAANRPSDEEDCASRRIVDGSLAGHLNTLLLQAQRPVGEGADAHGSLVGETARLDGGAEPVVLRASARGTRAAAAQGNGTGWNGAAFSTVTGTVAIGDGTGKAGASLSVATTDAASAVQSRTLQSLHAVVAHDGGRAGAREAPPVLGHWAGAGQVSVVQPTALADAAALLRSRGTAPVRQQGSDGAGVGGDAGMRHSPLQQTGYGAAVPDGLRGDAQTPDDFMEQLSEQVAFWVHQKTQRAELTLDRDGHTVRVQVALTGDAASVIFRSDHAEARQALDAGLDELRAMLRDQGLELAQASVDVAGGQGGDGTSGHGADPGAAGQRRHDAVMQVAVPDVAAAPSMRGAATRTLDIFV